MEDQHGFPNIKYAHPSYERFTNVDSFTDFVAPRLSTWETTLRDRLGVMKRLKKEQWRLLYREYERRGQRPFDLYANGVLVYPWNKVWKEFRRRRNLPLPRNLVLPATLTIRTLSATELEQEAPLIHSDPKSAVNTTIAVRTDASSSQRGWLDTAGADMREAFCGFIRVQTEGMPWNVNRLEYLAQIMGASEVYGKTEVDGSTIYALMPKDGFLDHVKCHSVGGRWLGRIADTRFPVLFLPDSTYLPSTELSTEFNAYHVLSWLVYLASNDFLGETGKPGMVSRWNDFLELLAKRVPPRIISAVFASNSLSIRAIWDNAIRRAYEVENGEALVFLIETILDRHFDWVEPIMNEYVLFAAAKSGSAGLVQKLLEKGAHPGRLPYFTQLEPERTAIIAAIDVEAWDSVRLLLQHCELEADLSLPTPNSTEIIGIGSLFRILFQHIGSTIAKSWRTDPEDGLRFFSRTEWSPKLGSFMIALRLLLKAGASVDVSCFWATECFRPLGLRLHEFHKINQTPLEWLPTYLELSLCWDEQLFNYLRTYSEVHSSTQAATRSGILKALLDGGNDGLDRYFRAKPRPAPHVLEMLLAEQFFINIYDPYHPTDRVNAGTIRLLIGYGVAINSNVVRNSGGISLLLRRVIASARNFGLDEDLEFILSYLIRHGAIICKHALRLAIGRSGTHMLEVLACHGADIPRDGKFALLEAVSQRNYEAVPWLLDSGANITSEFAARDSPAFYTLIGAAINREKIEGNNVERSGPLEPRYRPVGHWLGIQMIRLLHGKGAQLKVQTTDLSSYELLEWAAGIGRAGEGYFTLIVDLPDEMARLSDSDRNKIFARWGHMITCDQRLLECLRSRYEDFDTGFLLSAAIMKGSSGEDIGKLLGQASDVDFLRSVGWPVTPLQAAASTCNQQLVQTLLVRGADIDGRAVDGGASPLEAICSYKPSTSEEAEARDRLIRFLIDQGADWYAQGYSGETPLSTLATRGDVDNLRLFLEYGVDPNHMRYGSLIDGDKRYLFGDSPLDSSILAGRLDATHLLLKVGGLSADPGHTGYEGAIIRARHGTMREVIQGHIQQMRENFSQHPELEQKHRAMVDQQVRRREEAAREMGSAFQSYYEVVARDWFAE